MTHGPACLARQPRPISTYNPGKWHSTTPLRKETENFIRRGASAAFKTCDNFRLTFLRLARTAGANRNQLTSTLHYRNVTNLICPTYEENTRYNSDILCYWPERYRTWCR